MATRTIRPHRDDDASAEWQSMPEAAPSSIRKEGALAAQIFLFLGFFLVLVGGLAMIAPLTAWSYPIGPGLGYACLTVGVCLMLYHAFVDPEPQFRRLYGLFCLVLLATALVLRVFPFEAGLGVYFLPIGAPILFAALFFLIAVARSDTEPFWRGVARAALLGVGAALALWGLGRGFVDADFLAAEGIVSMLLGAFYLLAYLGTTDRSDCVLAERLSIALGAVGAIVLAAAAVRSIAATDFFVPSGLILGVAGLIALVVGVANVSDRPTVVLAKRELLSYFCSPIAYLVLFGLLFIFGIGFLFFIQDVSEQSRGFRNELFEPFVGRYVFTFFSVLAMVITIPVLTMRLLSEEKRSGSLEVLLTAPVNESSIVLGKFLAAWIFFLIAWLPFFLFMVAFRVFGDAPFDYRPLLSFFLALATTGASLIAIGLFFSSLTSNQIVAAVLTFAAVLLALALFWFSMMATEGMQDVIAYFSFLQLWYDTSRGLVPVRYFVGQASMAAFFLYLTTLTLSARKWS